MKKVVYNSCYGGFGLSEKAKERMIELGYKELELNSEYVPNKERGLFNSKYWDPYDISRTHPILVQVVEELGDDASGPYAHLKIALVEDKYRITEYDGAETVETPDIINWSS